jgi:Zn-finger nucleic acid-binding protein
VAYVGKIMIDECGHCGGVFLEHGRVAEVLANEQHDRAQALLDELVRRHHHPLPPSRSKSDLKCPVCFSVMIRKLSDGGAGVVLDVCRSHGTFFDAGELPLLIQFAQRESAERARIARSDPYRFRRVTGSPSRDEAPAPATFVSVALLVVRMLAGLP